MSIMKSWQSSVEDGIVLTAKNDLNVDSIMQNTQRQQLLDVSLAEDLKSLADIQSKERRREIKRTQLLPKYRSYVDSMIEEDEPHSLLLGWYLVWLFDCDELDQALKLSTYCKRIGLVLPSRFKRSLPVYCADEVLIWSERKFDQSQSCAPYFNEVFDSVHEGLIDVPDELRAKYYRLAGLIALDRNDSPAQAIPLLTKALELGALVKTKLADAQNLLKKQQQE